MKSATAWKKNSPTLSGSTAEQLFIVECQRRLWEVFTPVIDQGIDLVVKTEDKNGNLLTKSVQVTTGSQQYAGKSTYIISKPLEKVREDADIVAVHIHGEHNGINSGFEGKQDLWFLIPTEVYSHPKMYNNYTINTANSFGINIDKRFKPPLNIAFNAWWTMETPQEIIEQKVDLFFN